ncbi:hypothetical protein DFH07DRAFT_726065, partial [Mycena maculata]
FADDQLLTSLVNLYFANTNCFLPVLLRPQFEAGLNQHFHKTSRGFGTIILLVCALGSRNLSPTLSPPEHKILAWTWHN